MLVCTHPKIVLQLLPDESLLHDKEVVDGSPQQSLFLACKAGRNQSELHRAVIRKHFALFTKQWVQKELSMTMILFVDLIWVSCLHVVAKAEFANDSFSKYCNANTFFQLFRARFFQHVFMCCIAHTYIIVHLELPVCLESKRRPPSWSPPSNRCRLSTCIWRAGDLLSLSIAKIAANQLTPWLHVSLDIAFLLGPRTRFK